MDLKDKNVLVCGMARSGQAACLLLTSLGAAVTAQDIKEADKIEWRFIPEEKNIQLYLGKHPHDIIELFDLIVISPGLPVDLPFIAKARLLNIPVWSEVELAYRFCPCPIAAITGTNGKTTAAILAGDMLRRHNQNTFVAGNIGIPFSGLVTHLEPHQWVVVEISSFQLETVHNFRPKISAVLNLTPDHLDRHGTMEKYTALKERIFQNQNAEDYTVLNYDDPICRKMKPEGNVIHFSNSPLQEGVYLRGDKIYAKLNGREQFIADMNYIKALPELALASTAVALCAGVSAAAVKTSLYDFRGVEHRIEYVATVNGTDYYNDSKATNIESAVKAIEAMKKPIVLIGGGYDKKASFDKWVNAFNGKVKHLIVMGETAAQIIKACRTHNFNRYEQVNSLRDAVSLAAARSGEGDCVLLSPACASWDMYNDFEQRGNMFKQFVYELEGAEHGGG